MFWLKNVVIVEMFFWNWTFKKTTKKDGVQKQCITCAKQYHSDIREKKKNYEKQRRKTDLK